MYHNILMLIFLFCGPPFRSDILSSHFLIISMIKMYYGESREIFQNVLKAHTHIKVLI